MAYTIKRGDTLSKIAKQHGTTVSELAQANNITNPNQIRAGASLTIPGQSASSGGTGSTAASSPASLSVSNGAGGYRQVTYYDSAGNPATGYQKTGTTFSPSGNVVNTQKYLPGASGIAAYAGRLEEGYLEHASGYKGMGYRDAKGKYYTSDGSYLREDNFLYPEGAKISVNGMYFDVGNGWQAANAGAFYVDGDQTRRILVPGDTYGHSPGERLPFFDGWTGGAATGTAGTGGTGTGSTGGADEDSGAGGSGLPSASDIEKLLEWTYLNRLQDEWEAYIQGMRSY